VNLVGSLQFLKLGGSLITDKTQSHTPRLEVIQRIAGEIAAAKRQHLDLRLVLGHGSGSFGHVPAKKWGTRQGVKSEAEWKGFVDVWREADLLNRLVMDALLEAGVPALSFSPLSAVTSQEGAVLNWNLDPIRLALQAGLVPVVHGDVLFDLAWGGTILSTEDLFEYLARALRPQRIGLAGIEAGVWEDFPACTRFINKITPANFPALASSLKGSAATDVTGGMQSKVAASLKLVQEIEGLDILVFSGEQPGAISAVLAGVELGTILSAV
jgi:isopentenyl phosphate kinase